MTQPTSPLQFLVVAPRPAATRDLLTYATLEGLYQGIEAQGAQVHAEHLRPCSLAALEARLADGQQPPVAMLVVDAALGRGGATLLLEGAGQEPHELDGEALGRLLAKAGVALALLHLQPLGDGAESAAPLAEGLAAGGGAPVIRLREGLSEELARVLMSELLAQLLAGESVEVSAQSAQAAAGQAARRKEGPAPDLQLYGPGQGRLTTPAIALDSGISQVTPFSQRERGAVGERLLGPELPGGLPPEPPYGLLGRRREILELEALLAANEAAPVWLYGYDGIGKTALAAHVARWLVRTGRFERVVYTSLGRSGATALALYDLGWQLLGRDAAFGPDALDAILAALQETPTLILWDDWHAVLPGGEFSARPAELDAWYRLAGQVAAAGPSRLCILSDGPALPESAQRLPEVHSLGLALLDEPDAADLLAALCRWSGSEAPGPGARRALVDAVGGHPLTLRLMAACFLGAAPEEAARALLADLPGLAAGGARFRNEALEILFDRLLQAMPEALRHGIPALGLFVGGFPQHIGLGVMGLDQGAWEQQGALLARGGLLHEEALANLTAPYVRMHPALKRLARQRLDLGARRQFGATFRAHYLAFLTELMRNRERAAEGVAALAYHDIGNMGQALDLIMEDQDLVAAVNYGRLYTQLLEALGLVEEARSVTEQVKEATNRAIPREGPMGRPGVQLLWSQADRMIETGQLAPASALLQQLLERMSVQGGLNYIGMEADLDRARTLRRMGRTLRLARRHDLALAPLRRGMSLLNEQIYEPAVRRERNELRAELAEVLIAAGQYDEAEQECRASLQEIASLSDLEAEAGLYARLGVIAMRRNQTEQARQHYTLALERMRRAKDVAGMAAMEAQLASLALRPPANLEEARQHLRGALGHIRESDNPLLEGQIVMQLAQVAIQAEDGAEAERLFRQASALYREQAITPGLVATQASLADFLLQQGRAEEAQAEAEIAVEAAQGLGPDAAPWDLYYLLQRIAQERGQAEEVARWRGATQAAYARSSQAGPMRMRWQPVIDAVVQGARGEAMDADAAQTIEEMENVADWRDLGRAILRILSGERDEALWRDLDHVDALIVRAILDRLAEAPQAQTPSP